MVVYTCPQSQILNRNCLEVNNMAKKKKAKAPSSKKAKLKGKEKAPSRSIDLSTLKVCPECGSEQIYYSKMQREIICRACGGIFSELTPEQMKKFHEVSKVF